MNEEPMEAFQLSPQQRRVWLLQEGRTSLARATVRLAGELDASRLRAAVERVVARHEILRTRCLRRPGFRVPFQAIAPDADFRWDACDSEAAADSPEAELEALVESRRPPAIDLERGPVLAAELIRLAAGGHALLLVLPSICADAATLRLLAAEIAEAYAGVEPVGPGPLQYVDYSEWQHELLEASDEVARTARDFWRGRDLAATSSLSLPFEVRRDESPAEPAAEIRVLFPPELAARAAEAAAALGASPAEFWLACWLALLGRRTGASRPAVALRRDGRGLEELRGALGLFARWLPVSAPYAADQRFLDLMAQVVRAVREAEEHEQFFSLNGGEAPRSAAFGFELDDQPEAWTSAGLDFALWRREAASERFRLLLSCTRRGGGLEARFAYDPLGFEDRDVERLARELGALCRAALARPEEPVGTLELLDEDERRRLLVELNDTRQDFGPERCVHELFENAAAATPDQVAVVCEERSIRYGDLNARANQLAHHLRRLGVGSDVPVALCLERSVETVLAILAVWKAGGAYVPLDPDQPQRRLAQMIEDVAAPVVLTHRDFAVPGAARVVRLDADWSEIATAQDSDPLRAAVPANLAYVIFTSGSTGRPKGVCVEHRQLFNYVQSASRCLGLPAGGSYAVVSTFSADLGHTSIFPALCTGGTLHVLGVERASDAQAFREYFGRHAIDCLKIVPSHLQALQESMEPGGGLPRQRLILGGEASPRGWALDLAAGDPGCLVFNHYGPSETTVGVLTCPVRPAGLDPRAATVPLGSPMPNLRVYLLDRDLAPVPAWAAGEVFIGGAGVARGYCRRPDLTAERFVPDLWSGAPGARLYRTGDLARRLTDGKIEFLGRIDHQVKFHGFRVELGEIRGALNEHSQVRDSVVTKVQDRHQRDVLVAYYVSRQPVEVAELREWLADRIPEETIPNVFVHLRRLPLTLNGKVNVQALPSLEEVREKLEKQFVAPRNATEKCLAAIWAEVLGAPQVGVQDNFFELGGHSLLATRVVSRVRQALAIEMPLRSLFENPTIAGLAAAIAEGRFQPLRAAPPAPVAAAAAQTLEDQLAELERLSDQDVKELLGGI
ncbi:MAG TPA: amino acid adenylation domain-containing protein [Thermoanaerobaculia bacterium]